MRAAPLDEHPDGVFVEDAAVVFDEVAVITRPGAESRRGEVSSIADVLRRYRELRVVAAPATVDGGDVLRLAGTVYVGQSTRTNREGVNALREVLAPFGYRVVPVRLRGCLHLKSAASAVSENALLIDPDCVDAGEFQGARTITIDPAERGAANVLRLGGDLLVSASFPGTRKILERHGWTAAEIAYDELEKAEAGLTCCSLILRLPD